MTEVTEYILKKIETQKNIHLPVSIFKDENIKKIDSLIKNGSPISLSVFFKDNLVDKLNPNIFNYLSKELNNPRIISNNDQKLIEKLCEIKLKDPWFLFDYIGNFYYISDILSEVNNPESTINKSLRYTICLWVYLNSVELLTKFVASFIKLKIEKEDRHNKKYKSFLDSFKENKHPQIGELITTLENLEYIDKKQDSIFSEGRLIRNALSHANIYYDKEEDVFWLSNGNSYSVEQFQESLNNLYDFLLEFIYQYNSKSIDLISPANKELLNISRALQKIERSGTLKRKYREIYITINNK